GRAHNRCHAVGDELLGHSGGQRRIAPVVSLVDGQALAIKSAAAIALVDGHLHALEHVLTKGGSDAAEGRHEADSGRRRSRVTGRGGGDGGGQPRGRGAGRGSRR